MEKVIAVLILGLVSLSCGDILEKRKIEFCFPNLWYAFGTNIPKISALMSTKKSDHL